MRMSAEERHERIVELVRARGSLRVADLADAMNVSVATLRRDVEALALSGRLHRRHGAVVLPEAAGVFAPATAPAAAARARSSAVGGGVSGVSGGPVLGMVVPTASYYFTEVIRGAQTAAAQAGARLTLGVSEYRSEQDTVQVKGLLESGVDGLLLSPNWDAGTTSVEEQAVLGFGLPTVLVERRPAIGSIADGLDWACSDHARGASLAVRHLAGLGHRRIALLARPTTVTAPALRAGFQGALAALGLEGFETWPGDEEPPEPYESVFEQLADRLHDGVRTGAVRAAIVHTDLDAINLLRLLQARGLRIPEDLALVAYDDEMAALADVPLTAIAPPKRAVGAAAVRLLLHRMGHLRLPDSVAAGWAGADDAPAHHLELMPELRIRASCGSQQAEADRTSV